jgi:hypothetical protein
MVFCRFVHFVVLVIDKYRYGENSVANPNLKNHFKSPDICFKIGQTIFKKDPQIFRGKITEVGNLGVNKFFGPARRFLPVRERLKTNVDPLSADFPYRDKMLSREEKYSRRNGTCQ